MRVQRQTAAVEGRPAVRPDVSKAGLSSALAGVPPPYSRFYAFRIGLRVK